MNSVKFNSVIKSCAPLALVSLLALASLPASAVLVTSRAALAAQDFVDWGQFGPSGSLVAPPATATSNLNWQATVTNSGGGDFIALNAGDFAGNLGGNVLFTNFNESLINISFNVALSGVGAQIQANDFGAFTGVLKAYDAANMLLETVSFAGVSNDNQDDSAIFLGMSRLTADISRIEFSVTGPANPEFAINQLDMQLTPIPEPASLVLFAAGLAGLAGWRKSRRLSD